MKHFAAFLVVALSFALGTMMLPLPAEQKVNGPASIVKGKKAAGKDVRFGEVECDRLVIRSENGKHSLTMTSFPDGVGVWLNHGKDNVALVSMNDQPPWIGLINSDDNGCPIAIARGKDGEAFVQITDGKKFKSLGVQEILKLLKAK